MARFYDGLTGDAIDLATLFARIAKITAPSLSDAYMDECALHLAALGNNRNLVSDHLQQCGGLAGWCRSFSGAQSFILGSSEDVSVRANIWLPRKDNGYTDYERDLYAYDLAHSHDFRFLTAGYFGPGYETDLYRFDPDTADGTPGQKVELTAARRERLSLGRVMYYEQYTDVHIQHEPESLSISLNLLFRKEPRVRDQILFDMKESKVIGVPALAERGKLLTALEASAFFADGETLQMLETYASSYPNPRIAAHAKRLAQE